MHQQGRCLGTAAAPHAVMLVAGLLVLVHPVAAMLSSPRTASRCRETRRRADEPMMASWPQAGLVEVVVQRRPQGSGQTVGSWLPRAGWRLLGRPLQLQLLGLSEQQHHRYHQLLGTRRPLAMPMECILLVLVAVVAVLVLRLQGLLEQQHHRCHHLLGLLLVHFGVGSPPCSPSSADVVAVGRRQAVSS